MRTALVYAASILPITYYLLLITYYLNYAFFFSNDSISWTSA